MHIKQTRNSYSHFRFLVSADLLCGFVMWAFLTYLIKHHGMNYNFVFKFSLLSFIICDMLIFALKNIQIGVQRSRKPGAVAENNL